MYSFRFRALTRAGQVDFSQIVTLLVHCPARRAMPVHHALPRAGGRASLLTVGTPLLERQLRPLLDQATR
jgi:hypothetical protein